MDYFKEKLNHAGFQKYLKNTSWMFLGRISSLIVSFFVSVYAARNLGVDNFGTLNFVISFVGIAGSSFFVIDSILLKKLNDTSEDVNAILGASFVIKLANAAISIVVATAASLLFAHSQLTTMLVFVFSTYTIFQALGAVDLRFQAMADVRQSSVASMIIDVITAIIRIVIISLRLPIVYLLASYVSDSFFSAISYLYLYKRNFGSVFDWKLDKNMIKNIIQKSWPFTVSALATTIYVTVDQIFLKYFLGSGAVGLYVVAVRFSEVWFFISSVICASLLPAILNAQKTNYELFIERSKKLYFLLFYLSIAICVFIFIIAPLIISILYGPAYAESIVLLRIYIWSIIGIFVSTALQQILLAQNKFRTILVLNLVGMVLSLILNPIFIHYFGIQGAAYGNIFTYTLPVICLLATTAMKDQRKSVISAIFNPLQFLRL
jgi:O-antigen/teichoic acid export membrane protein